MSESARDSAPTALLDLADSPQEMRFVEESNSCFADADASHLNVKFIGD